MKAVFKGMMLHSTGFYDSKLLQWALKQKKYEGDVRRRKGPKKFHKYWKGFLKRRILFFLFNPISKTIEEMEKEKAKNNLKYPVPTVDMLKNRRSGRVKF